MLTRQLLIGANRHVWVARSSSTWSALYSAMDGTPSRHISFSLQVEETTTDDEIVLDNRHHHTCDSMNGEMDRSEIIFGIEEGLESGISKMGDVQVSLLL